MAVADQTAQDPKTHRVETYVPRLVTMMEDLRRAIRAQMARSHEELRRNPPARPRHPSGAD